MKKFVCVFFACMIFLSSLIVPVSAMAYPDEYPELPVGYDGQIIYLGNDNNIYAITYEDNVAEVYYTATNNLVRLQFRYLDNVTQFGVVKFKLVDNEWVETFNGTWTSQSTVQLSSVPEPIFYATQDILTNDGDVFFPFPLEVQIQRITQKTMNTQGPQVVGVMKILTLCGVGLLALLIGLNLFSTMLKV